MERAIVQRIGAFDGSSRGLGFNVECLNLGVLGCGDMEFRCGR